MEIINTGNLKRIGHENTEDAKANKLFQGVFGVGGFYVYSLIPFFKFTVLDMSCYIPTALTSYGVDRGEDSLYVV